MNQAAKSFVLICFVSSLVFAETSSVRVASGKIGQVQIAAFKLKQASELEVSGGVARVPGRMQKQIFETRYFAWLLNSHTREVVWESPLELDRRKDPELIDFKQSLKLKEGDYELHYSTVRFLYNIKLRGAAAEELHELMKRRPNKPKEIDLKDLYVEVAAPKKALEPTESKDLQKKIAEDAAISIRGVGDSANVTQGFSLEDTTNLKIYAQGEGFRRSNEIFDYAWIEDLDRNERVWEMNVREAKMGGGGRKNLLVRETITLPKGKYLVHYISDDSHSAAEWNEQPPFDPSFWGITIWPAKESDQRNLRRTKMKVHFEPLVTIREVGNNQRIRKGIEVSEPVSVRVVCVGEMTHSGRADWGWISDADTGRVIWEPTPRNTRHAGGAKKNRVATDLVTLEKGRYIVQYKSDSSHAYDSWNSSKPRIPSLWGITLWTVDEKSVKKVKVFDDAEVTRRKALLFIKGKSAHLYEEKSFTVKRTAKIQVVALGEGTADDGMVDWGWIENDDTGRLVWEMKYDRTTHAGGADKNRLANAELTLEPGNYKIYYETDDSHHVDHWNAGEPNDPDQYGIKIYLVE